MLSALPLWPVHAVGMLRASASEHTLVHAQPMDGSTDETGIEKLVKLFSGSSKVLNRLNQKMMVGSLQDALPRNLLLRALPS